LIGVGGTTQTRKGGFLTARLAKEVLPNIPVIYGGPHASFACENTLENVAQIDFILRGEAEFSLLALARHFIPGAETDLLSIPGIALRRDGEVYTKEPERIDDLSVLPMPARDLLDRDYPMTIDHTDIPADFIVTSRGCPVTCDFCSASRMFPGGTRLRPISSVRRELEWIRRNKPHVAGIKVFDSTFTANREHVIAFSALTKEFGYKWECELRVDTVDFELLQIMRDSGCVFVSIGFESTDNKLLKRVGKRITREQVEQVLLWCKGLSIITKVFFTFGHLEQELMDCLNDLKYLKANRDLFSFFCNNGGNQDLSRDST